MPRLYSPFAAGHGNWRDFLLLRLGRLWPAHAAMLAVWLVAFAAAVALGIPYDGSSQRGLAAYAVANLLMVHAWGLFDWYDLNPPSWSVSAEWFCYLLFPLLVPVVARLRGALTILSAAILLVAMAWLALRTVGLDGLVDYQRFGLIRAVSGFGLGMLVWRLGRSAPHLVPRHLADIAMFAVLALLAMPDWRAGEIDYAMLALFAALVLGLSRRGSLLTGWLLGLRAMVWLGEISYSFYLVHWFMLIVLIKLWRYLPAELAADRLAYGLGVALASLAGAIVLHRVVEQPARAAMRRYVGRGSARPIQADRTGS